ncbi:hypothetical protein GGTG_12980 [Gaeumannomyces tritici R3-111a-1]|uniref:Uncharacterized protein n=1 Tax=Gaeumannomyces tritici (strain R3-111a-1) TaxID=644352 RepID=J3PHK0_GAET3|nr:hypothetical protein GGTG_12980 [Gaeumannomyces tritici R3-111a-1]EJT69361.1 hypothetical protein GGTG_12980 [Gaeumannomyces tritici R3-111a-1]
MLACRPIIFANATAPTRVPPHDDRGDRMLRAAGLDRGRPGLCHWYWASGVCWMLGGTDKPEEPDRLGMAPEKEQREKESEKLWLRRHLLPLPIALAHCPIPPSIPRLALMHRRSSLHLTWTARLPLALVLPNVERAERVASLLASSLFGATHPHPHHILVFSQAADLVHGTLGCLQGGYFACRICRRGLV